MHTALLWITGLLLLAALILIFRRSLIAFIAVMVLFWWAGDHYTDPAEFEALRAPQVMVAKTVEGYALAVTTVVGAVEHQAEALGFTIPHPST